jgi:hypothetical protein
MKIFGNQRMIRRISKAGEKKLQMLYQEIFDCPALPMNVERIILKFEGYDADDYEAMVRERARDMEEDDLQFIGWLLGLETDRSVDGLSNSICQFLCSRPNSERDGVSSTSSSIGERSFRTKSVAESLTIEDIRKKLMRLQEEEDISRNGGEKVQRWLHDGYNGSYDVIQSTKSFKIIRTSKNSMVTSRSQRPESMVAGKSQ